MRKKTVEKGSNIYLKRVNKIRDLVIPDRRQPPERDSPANIAGMCVSVSELSGGGAHDVG